MSRDRDDVWARALALAAAGDLDAAERLVLDAVDHLGAYASVARLHELEMDRRLAAGDRAAAEHAFERSCRWMRVMAAHATSGGEGEALSRDADAHEQALVSRLRAASLDRRPS